MSSPSSKARDPPRAVADHRGWEAVDLGQKSRPRPSPEEGNHCPEDPHGRGYHQREGQER